MGEEGESRGRLLGLELLRLEPWQSRNSPFTQSWLIAGETEGSGELCLDKLRL